MLENALIGDAPAITDHNDVGQRHTSIRRPQAGCSVEVCAPNPKQNPTRPWTSVVERSLHRIDAEPRRWHVLIFEGVSLYALETEPRQEVGVSVHIFQAGLGSGLTSRSSRIAAARHRGRPTQWVRLMKCAPATPQITHWRSI